MNVFVLPHGLARGSGSFWMMEKVFSKAGYYVLSVEYPSTTTTVSKLAQSWRSHAARNNETEKLEMDLTGEKPSRV